MPDLPRSVRTVSALARTVDPGLPSNRFALFIGAVTFLGVLAAEAIGGGGAGAAVSEGFCAGAGVFLAWALGRELDPDHVRTARYAGFAAVVALLLGTPDLGAVLALLLAVRVVARPTGMHPTVWDLIGAVVIAWMAAGDPTGVIAALGLAAALVWDTRLPQRAPRSTGLGGAIVLSAAVVSAILGGALFAGWRAPGLLEAVVFLLAMAAATRQQVHRVDSLTDVTREPLHADRVRAGRVLAGLALAGTVVWVGGPAIGALGPAWAAFVATGFVRWRHLLRPASSPWEDEVTAQG